jgi:hypothetical protein
MDAFPNYQNVESRWGLEDLQGVDHNRLRKQVVKAAGTAGGIASNAAQIATGTSGYALATGAVAASALGIGIVAVGGVLTIGSSVYAARSAYRTHQHLKVLREILARGNQAFPCRLIPPGGHPLLAADPPNFIQHNMVFEQVLPYVIAKKDAKLTRKVASAVPGVGVLEGVRAVAKKAYKAVAGTLGEHRREAARWLAVHLVTHNCGLAQAIVAALYSVEELHILETFDSDKLVPLLMDKMKST